MGITYATSYSNFEADSRSWVNSKKYNFGAKYCSYLGHIVGGEVLMEISKLEAVQNFPIPITKKEVRAFLGITGYYCSFIPSIAAALTNLIQKSSPNKIRLRKNV